MHPLVVHFFAFNIRILSVEEFVLVSFMILTQGWKQSLNMMKLLRQQTLRTSQILLIILYRVVKYSRTRFDWFSWKNGPSLKNKAFVALDSQIEQNVINVSMEDDSQKQNMKELCQLKEFVYGHSLKYRKNVLKLKPSESFKII